MVSKVTSSFNWWLMHSCTLAKPCNHNVIHLQFISNNTHSAMLVFAGSLADFQMQKLQVAKTKCMLLSVCSEHTMSFWVQLLQLLLAQVWVLGLYEHLFGVWQMYWLAQSHPLRPQRLASWSSELSGPLCPGSNSLKLLMAAAVARAKNVPPQLHVSIETKQEKSYRASNTMSSLVTHVPYCRLSAA